MCMTHLLIKLYSSRIFRDALQRKNVLILREVSLWYNPEQNRFGLLAAARSHAPTIAMWRLLFLSMLSQRNFIHFMDHKCMDWHQPLSELEGTLLESTVSPVKIAKLLPLCPTSAFQAQFVETLQLKKAHQVKQ